MIDTLVPLAITCPECARPPGADCITTNTAKRCSTHKARIAEAKGEELRHAQGIAGILTAATPRALGVLRDFSPDTALRRGVDGIYRSAGALLPPSVTAELRRLGLLREACGQGGHVAVLTRLGRDLVLELRRAGGEEARAHG